MRPAVLSKIVGPSPIRRCLQRAPASADSYGLRVSAARPMSTMTGTKKPPRAIWHAGVFARPRSSADHGGA